VKVDHVQEFDTQSVVVPGKRRRALGFTQNCPYPPQHRISDFYDTVIITAEFLRAPKP
jgi:hypothetical protein